MAKSCSLTFAKSMGWTQADAKHADKPPQTNGCNTSAIFSTIKKFIYFLFNCFEKHTDVDPHTVDLDKMRTWCGVTLLPHGT